MKTKRLTREKIKKIHKMLDEKKTHQEIMDALGVTRRQVSYQVGFRPKTNFFDQLRNSRGY